MCPTMTRNTCCRFLSTPSARRATARRKQSISVRQNFYPRPPRGGRHFPTVAVFSYPFISIHALREEGDGSDFNGDGKQLVFLSTPSARRATSPKAASRGS